MPANRGLAKKVWAGLDRSPHPTLPHSEEKLQLHEGWREEQARDSAFFHSQGTWSLWTSDSGMSPDVPAPAPHCLVQLLSWSHLSPTWPSFSGQYCSI